MSSDFGIVHAPFGPDEVFARLPRAHSIGAAARQGQGTPA